MSVNLSQSYLMHNARFKLVGYFCPVESANFHIKMLEIKMYNHKPYHE